MVGWWKVTDRDTSSIRCEGSSWNDGRGKAQQGEVQKNTDEHG